ncbi:MAG TPA: hypothetical protein EYH44_01275 [Thermoprotei archaeon]|nr:hypothetical protein [Thermoprotei archaeon]
MKNERNLTAIINSVLRGEINWREIKDVFIKTENLETDNNYVTIVVTEEPDKDIQESIYIKGFTIQKNDIIKVDKDTYLKLKNTNIVREVNKIR